MNFSWGYSETKISPGSDIQDYCHPCGYFFLNSRLWEYSQYCYTVWLYWIFLTQARAQPLHYQKIMMGWAVRKMMIRCYIFHHNTLLCFELMDLGVKLSLAGQEELYLGVGKYLYDLWEILLFTMSSSVQSVIW